MNEFVFSVSIVIPAKDESASIGHLVLSIREAYPAAEIIVVNDGSSDNTGELAAAASAKVVTHPYSKGNGAAIKAGARAAQGDIIVFIDADGQHHPEDIARLLAKVEQGYDMVVGARGRGSQASHQRAFANGFYNWLASKMVGQPVADLTSGFRAVRRGLFLRYIELLPNGFSYPTTITMAFFRAGYSVAYLPINAAQRKGKSHIRPIKDGARFLLIIFKIGSLYSPLKIFVPISATFFFVGILYYLYTFLAMGRFTNMSALLFTNSALIFLIGLVSEQVTSLIYLQSSKLDE